MQLPAGQQPTSSLFYQPFCAEDACTILGGRDGVLRRFHKHRRVDDGKIDIQSFVDYGPVLLGDQAGYMDGILAEMQPITGGEGQVLVECRAGNSAEAAYLAEVQYSDFAEASALSWASQPRVRGNAAFLRLSGVEGAHWTVESIMCRIAPGGRMRR
ncbi:MAG: hypothetical protein IPJ01_12790 [Micavibrio sp.]|nr:hypothetical protein [Micavibrio sp.]